MGSSELLSRVRLEKHTDGTVSTSRAVRGVSNDHMTKETANITCFKHPYKLFPCSSQESPGKCFFSNRQPITSYPDDGLRQTYLFISPAVRKKDLAGAS